MRLHGNEAIFHRQLVIIAALILTNQRAKRTLSLG
ncbi:hypothetical protein SCTVLC_1383 [Serratia symbiotica SCt-VLC]|uniref:Uncharacterized protein n=1 Tax=Serratia symbiotica SCt-VLC TaxID=1347341 RepID=A0A068RBU9_9GAMM|nr:hypothetical protein SCTVLC_1383 [Serratia symbiotica SCt-VLC]